MLIYRSKVTWGRMTSHLLAEGTSHEKSIQRVGVPDTRQPPRVPWSQVRRPTQLETSSHKESFKTIASASYNLKNCYTCFLTCHGIPTFDLDCRRSTTVHDSFYWGGWVGWACGSVTNLWMDSGIEDHFGDLKCCLLLNMIMICIFPSPGHLVLPLAQARRSQPTRNTTQYVTTWGTQNCKEWFWKNNCNYMCDGQHMLLTLLPLYRSFPIAPHRPNQKQQTTQQSL